MRVQYAAWLLINRKPFPVETIASVLGAKGRFGRDHGGVVMPGAPGRNLKVAATGT